VKQGLVSDVNTVEVADGDHGIFIGLRDIINAFD
jgi:hypothetical protein